MRLPIVFAFAALLACAPSARADQLTPAIVDPAVAIQSALAKDSLEGVPANAGAIEEQARKLGAPAAKIGAAAKELQGAAKLAEARTAFGKLSEAIVAYVDSQKLSLDPRFKIAFCPMALKPWIQKDGPIQNPYYGTEMPTCGSFRK
jgi:predicted component of type VI protein secretion system